MKPINTIWLIFGLLLCGLIALFFATNADANPQFFISYEGMQNYSANRELPIAEETVPDPEANLRLLTGDLVRLTHDQEYSYRASAGVRFYDYFDVVFSYGNLIENDQKNDGPFKHTTNLSFLGADDDRIIDQNQDILRSLTTGFATGGYSQEIVDLEGGYNFDLVKTSFRISAGVRYAEYKQWAKINRFQCRVGVNRPECYPVILEEVRDLKLKTYGLGPKIGLSFDRPLNLWNLSMTGSTAWAALFVKSDLTDRITRERIHLTRNFSRPVFDYALKQRNKKSTIYNFEAKGGIKYSFKNRFSVTAGYQYAMNNDVLTTRGTAVRNYHTINPFKNQDAKTYGKSRVDKFTHGPLIKMEMSF